MKLPEKPKPVKQASAPAAPSAPVSWGENPKSWDKKSKKRFTWKRKYTHRLVGVLTLSGVLGGYFGYFFAPVYRYPGKTGQAALEEYFDCAKTLEKCLTDLVPDSKVYKEVAYLNNNVIRTEAVSRIIGTVSWKPPVVPLKNRWGKTAKSPWNWNVRRGTSDLTDDVKVVFTVPDYNKITFAEKDLKRLLKEAEVTPESVDADKKLTNVFALYLTKTKIPTKEITRIPEIECKDNCKVLPEEDAYWDTFLFASEGFKGLQSRFLTAANKILGTKFKLESNWIGVSKAVPRKGDGTFKHPAGINTPVITHLKDVPLEVTLTKFVKGEDTFPIFFEKSSKNRGFTDTSDLTYLYYVFKVKNLSKEPLEVYLNDTLADSNRNPHVRVGTMYGLENTPRKILPGESLNFESWSSSSSLTGLHLIWGADYPRDVDPIWFDVLGD